MELKDIIDIVDGLGTLGVLILVAYKLSKENSNFKKELKESQDQRIIDLKHQNENSESLLEKVLVALQENQKFLDNKIERWTNELRTDLSVIKEKLNKP